MDAALEVLKGRSIQYEIELVKSKVDATIITQLSVLDADLPKLDILEKEVKTKDDLTKLGDFIKYLKSEIPPRIHRDLREELSEIKEDFKWKQTEHGRRVIELENWIHQARTELDLRRDDTTVFVGKSFSDPLKLLITGRLKSAEEKIQLESLVKHLKPPVAPNYEIEITTTHNNR